MIPLLRVLFNVQGTQIAARRQGESGNVQRDHGQLTSAVTSRKPVDGGRDRQTTGNSPVPIPETLQQRIMRLERTMRESQECLTCGKRPPMDYTNQFLRFDGFEQIIVLICDECKKLKRHELDGIWR